LRRKYGRGFVHWTRVLHTCGRHPLSSGIGCQAHSPYAFGTRPLPSGSRVRVGNFLSRAATAVGCSFCMRVGCILSQAIVNYYHVLFMHACRGHYVLSGKRWRMSFPHVREAWPIFSSNGLLFGQPVLVWGIVPMGSTPDKCTCVSVWQAARARHE
jgi:hypothetical protein